MEATRTTNSRRRSTGETSWLPAVPLSCWQGNQQSCCGPLGPEWRTRDLKYPAGFPSDICWILHHENVWKVSRNLLSLGAEETWQGESRKGPRWKPSALHERPGEGSLGRGRAKGRLRLTKTVLHSTKLILLLGQGHQHPNKLTEGRAKSSEGRCHRRSIYNIPHPVYGNWKSPSMIRDRSKWPKARKKMELGCWYWSH